MCAAVLSDDEPNPHLLRLNRLLVFRPSLPTDINKTSDPLGWLEREQDPADARSTLLRLTDKAQAGVAEWRDRRASILADVIERLPAKDRHGIESAIPSLRALVDLLQASQ
jgi:hypothetical protein